MKWSIKTESMSPSFFGLPNVVEVGMALAEDVGGSGVDECECTHALNFLFPIQLFGTWKCNMHSRVLVHCGLNRPS
jgi:hypothetical protein